MPGFRPPSSAVSAGLLGLVILLSACSDESAHGDQLPVGARAQSAVPSSTQVPSEAAGLLGTIEATMDGDPRIWYVVTGEATDGPYSSGVWLETSGGTILSLGGLDSGSPPIGTFSRGGVGGTGAILGNYEGSALNLQIRLPEGASSAEFRLPDSDASAGLVYLPDAAVQEVNSMLMMASGTVVVEDASRTGDKVQVRGTFSGSLQRAGGGEPVQITGGRFEVRGIPPVSSVSGGGGR